MADVDVDIDVEDLERLEHALRRGVNDGAGDSARWHVDEGKNKAQDLLRLGHRGRSRIWTRQTYNGFRQHIERNGNNYHAELQNISPHAHIVEYGRRPGATPPQVQHLMEWVVAKLSPASYNPDLVPTWEPELQALAQTYGPGYVRTAFNVQDKIRREGIRGIRFMGKTESYLKQVGGLVTHQKVEAAIEKQLRAHGI